MDLEELTAISPIDGRYRKNVTILDEYFSEFGLLKLRVEVEIKYYSTLTKEKITLDFTLADARWIKNKEEEIKHDVKAIEYFLRLRVKKPELVHFGLTTYDVTIPAYALALSRANVQVIIPAINQLVSQLEKLVDQTGDLIMLGRTHGQPAVPTTMGKEIKNFAVRVEKILGQIKDYKFEAKLSGAVGNFNALVIADPKKDWVKFSDDFIKSLGLVPNHFTTQILPYDNWLQYFSLLKLLNNVLIGFCQDMWRYISDDYLVQAAVASEVGSSTMPQKVNPIDFENAEGNLGLANALFEFYERKLPISRLQRDLSDSTVKRTFGVALGHSLFAYQKILSGLDKISPNKEKMEQELESRWEVITEGIQTILRAEGVPNAYEDLKNLARGKKIDRKLLEKFVTGLKVAPKVKKRLLVLTPQNYTGLAKELAWSRQ